MGGSGRQGSLIMASLPERQHSTVAQIIQWRERQDANEQTRPYLGASQIGASCSRALWYSFRWATQRQFDGRMLRLFERGQREEAVFIAELRAIGATVHEGPEPGKQFGVQSCGGHFRGHMDGAAIGLPEAPDTWHVLEFKTHNAKSFADLQKNGVAKSKPVHHAQMQIYMALTGMTRAMYLAVNKDTDELYGERISADAEEARRLLNKAAQIIFAPEPPPGVSTKPDWYECKMCDHYDLCHGTAAPLPTCRSCAHATPELDGTWTCERQGYLAMNAAMQRDGCSAHRFIPSLLSRWAELIDANDALNVAKYRNTLTGNEFENGEWSSVEIHAATDKRAIGDAGVNQWRQAFDAKISG